MTERAAIAAPAGWALALRLALREARGRPGALWLLFVCVCLGVLAIAGVGSLRQAIDSGLAAQGQTILGGDIAASFTGRAPTAAERRALDAIAIQSSDSVSTRAMLRTGASADSGDDSAAIPGQLVELKAVDAHWPLYGAARIATNTAGLRAALANGVIVAEALASRLDLHLGQQVRIGNASFPITGILRSEPDRASQGFSFGPTVLLALDRLPATGLIQPGSLYHWQHKLKLPAHADAAALSQRLQREFPHHSWQLRDRDRSAPGLSRFVTMLAQFLTLISLAALAIAGVGVGNGVASQLARRTDTIATLKTLGAPRRLIARTYLLLILGVALAGALAGMLAGALVPLLVVQLAGDALPVPPALGVYPWPLLRALVYGLLVALAFALWPLARAAALPPARIFRTDAAGAWRVPRRTLAGMAGLAAAVVALAMLDAADRRLAALFLLGTILMLALLYSAGAGIVWLAARLPRPRPLLARLALSSLHRPGNFTRELTVALGLGLGLFAMLALIETSMHGDLQRTVPEKAPTFFLLDLPKEDLGEFRATLPPGSRWRVVPSLRGPVTAINGTPASEFRDLPPESYVLNGDRGITFAAAIPAGNRIVAGRWWPADYAGPPLVSMEAEQARLLGLGVGDQLTVSVLGVPITATIASLRQVDWESFDFNFVLVFDPANLAGAPYSYMATITPPAAARTDFARRIGARFPTASLIRVDDVLGQVTTLVGQMGIAIRAAAAVTILAGVAVLIGALAAQSRLRRRDNLILKLLGATRRQLLLAAALEFAVLATAVGVVAWAAGTLAAWLVVTRILGLDWQPNQLLAGLTLLAGGCGIFALGMAAAWRALGVRVATGLRDSG